MDLVSALPIALVTLSLASSAACAALSWRHPARVAGALSGDARALAGALRALPSEARPAELARRCPPDSWERRLAHTLMEPAPPAATLAAINDLLAEIDRRIDVSAAWPPAAVRLAALGALLLATLSFLTRAGVAAIVLILAAGAASAIVSSAASRAGRAAAHRQREAIDALVSVLVGDVGPLEAADPTPRDRRRRGRGRRSRA